MEVVKRLFCLLALLPALSVVASSKDGGRLQLGCKAPFGQFMYEQNVHSVVPLPCLQEACEDVSCLVKFQLYNKPGDDARILTLGDVATLSTSGFDSRKRTMMLMPGYGQSPTDPISVRMRDALLAHASYNVIIADYVQLLAKPWLQVALDNTPPIGRHVARFIDFLAAHEGLRTSSLHVIGLSLGAHVAGQVGAFVRSGRVARITGLDPAKTGVTKGKQVPVLNKAQAHFIDVIHTDIHGDGINGSVGHVDFYPNGGTNQPGCQKEELAKKNYTGNHHDFCNHLKSSQFFVESLRREHAFPAKPCNAWKNFKANKCH